MSGVGWVREQKVREALTGILPPRSVRAWGNEVLVQPADYQWDVTARALRDKGYSVTEEPQGGWLRLT